MPEVMEKWGFGMAPLKPVAERLNRKAIINVKGFIVGDSKIVQNNIIDDISTVKGIFNRILKQNQWDWFTVNMYMDFPRHKDMVNIVSALGNLRKAIQENDNDLGIRELDRLVHSRFLVYCDNYLSYNNNEETLAEYLYILSRREEKDILKIGMTTRNIQKRVNEINSATGVVFPFSARKVYKVKNCKLVEKEIHMLLSKYRIRKDREFFRIGFKEACTIIENYLTQNNQYYYDD